MRKARNLGLEIPQFTSYGRAFHSSAHNSDCALSFFVRQSLHEGETVELLPGESFAVHLGMFYIEITI